MKRIALILAGFIWSATSAAAQEVLDEPALEEPASELKAIVDSCTAHKFETMIVVDGSGRGKRVKICGVEGQSDADWLVTLRDSAAKTAADETMAEPIKDQIVAALTAEIERLEKSAVAVPVTVVPVATIQLPPQPMTVPEATPRYSQVPAMPPPIGRKTDAATGNATPPPPRLRLTLRCALPRETFAACSRLERATQLLVRADETLSAGTSLRFVRGGETRAELDLGALRKGESLREKLPGRVCSGVLRGRVEVQVLSKSRVAETLGPFNLYCGS